MCCQVLLCVVKCSGVECSEYFPGDVALEGSSAITLPNMRKRPSVTMNATFKPIKPAALSRQILALTRELEVLAQAKAAARPRPPVNRSWNTSTRRRNPNEATS